MKKLLVLALASLSLTAMANPFNELDNALSNALVDSEIMGQSSDGSDCRINYYRGQVSIINLAPGCIDASTNTVNLKCLAQFNYNQHPSRMTAKKLVITDYLILAEVKSKDSEQYSSAVTSKIEVKLGNRTEVKIYDTKNFIGRYKRTLDCSF
ncbi:MAG: hypothetical protein ACLGHN_09195 [Bacteriovoracia bacterium]